ncbi:LptF/LptG family permease [Botrimarina hoheduenensis]|uniref:Putative permease YjgP/YjgQ family protein n=1 Tax=Botrimarina hoheduenensis TaxID=2528000 RepID=A0A5C5WF09_9BACT|nr:LptF/LptG family permease [Botrimarina hoheduenensis]TWT48342.1 putative permease YjgP/YjgQ family protein [Botrimarina hoheduenensis]
MRILTRYIIVELLQVFFLTLAGLTALIFLALVGREAINKGLGLGPLLRMAPYLVPQAMQFAVPGTMLLATTSVYGRLSAFNEVVALKSMGISPWKIIGPTLIVAAATSFVAVGVNDLAVSWGRLGVQRVFVESLEEVIYGQLRLHRSYVAEGVRINVVDVRDRLLIRPTLTVQGKGGREPITISAAAAEMRSIPAEQKLQVAFRDLDVEGPIKYADPSVFVHEIDLAELFDEADSRSPSNYALAEIGAERAEMRRQTDLAQRDHAAQQMLGLMTGDTSRLGVAEREQNARLIGELHYRERRLSVEPFRRWANGFSCLCFVMVGAPMAILRQKGEFLASFFLCFLPILLVYYPLLIVSVDHAKAGDISPAAVWIGNLVLALWGLSMMRRVARH